jgi:hypothetical protein
MEFVRSPRAETPGAPTGLTNLVGTMFPGCLGVQVAGAAGTNSIPPKSGHRCGCAGDPSGTLRAITRFRSRSSNLIGLQPGFEATRVAQLGNLQRACVGWSAVGPASVFSGAIAGRPML